jgi:type I site-specific restriction endonuclease
LEAKREDVDPYDAKEQARGYAENLKAPFIILSNGREHWFWNYTRIDQDAYRIERLPSREDLERIDWTGGYWQVGGAVATPPAAQAR